MSSSYSITFINNSGQFGTACLFQKSPDQSGPYVVPLAWFTRSSPPNATTVFSWSIDYSFFWSKTGALRPGVKVNPRETVSADLQGSNSITFTSAGSDNFQFSDQQQGQQPGSLVINCDTTIPPNTVSVGIGMSDACTFCVQARPNMMNAFTPQPSYWLVFGQYQQGQVLDVDRMSDAVRVEFSGNVYNMSVTLNADNSFTIEQGR
jgi:hypothetical protein